METKLKQLISEDLTIPQIAQKIGKSPRSVCRLLKKFGLKTNRHVDRDKTATTKKCRYCNEEKETKDFPVAATINGEVYLRHKCNVCYLAMKADRRKAIAVWIREIKKTLCCSKCGNDDFRVLEFHHKDDNKEFNIGDAPRLAFGRKKILDEIKKCDVLCANCHRIITFESYQD